MLHYEGRATSLESRQVSIAERCVSGRTTYCAEFAAASAEDDRAGRFVATVDHGLAVCHTAPTPCS